MPGLFCVITEPHNRTYEYGYVVIWSFIPFPWIQFL